MASQDDECPWGPKYSEYKFTHILHQVRNPLLVIPYYPGEESKKFMVKHIGNQFSNNEILFSMKYWYEWNLKAESISQWTYQIEKLSPDYPIFIKTFIEKLGSPSYLDKNLLEENIREMSTWRIGSRYVKISKRVKNGEIPLRRPYDRDWET